LAAHPTLSRIWPAAALPEREIFEMLGIPFANNEQLGPLLLDEQFPGYPLRQDFSLPEPETYAVELLEQRHEEALLSLLPQAEEPLPIPISLEQDTPEAADDAHE
jgi:NADH:ubiquinone oxidoreductase subunit C